MVAATSHAPGFRESTTAAGRVPARRPVLHPRLAAAAAAVSCAAHIWFALSGRHGLWAGVLMLMAAAVCLPCTVHIWRHSRVGALHRMTASALAMVLLHAALLAGTAGGGHAHGAAPPSSALAPAGTIQLLLVIGMELATALLAATLVARLRCTAGSAVLPASLEPTDARANGHQRPALPSGTRG